MTGKYEPSNTITANGPKTQETFARIKGRYTKR